MAMMTQFRYSKYHFRQSLAVALGLTATVSGLTWMLLTIFSSSWPRFWTGMTALIFFAFLSAGMLQRYFLNGVVVAIYPTGLYDARHGSQIIAWETIRDMVIRQHEDEYAIDVYLWHSQEFARKHGNRPDFTIDLASLEANAEQLVQAITRYKPVNFETAPV
jgi:hypothetical protein